MLNLVVAVGSFYLPLVAATGFALSVLTRRVFISLVAFAVLVVTLAVQLPWYYFSRPAEVGPYTEVRVLSSNLRKGQAEASSFVDLAGKSADVVTVSELTPEAVRRYSQAGIDENFPYSMLSPAPGAAGIGLWSRFPLAAAQLKNAKTAIAAARLQIPGVRFEPLVASIHVISPVAYDWDSIGNWRNGISSVKEALRELSEAANPGAVIVAGDFNSTPDLRQFRELLNQGCRDAVEQTGAGFAPTFPSNSWLPPIITIDHLLTCRTAASSIRTVNIRGSDHRALIAAVKIPLDPMA